MYEYFQNNQTTGPKTTPTDYLKNSETQNIANSNPHTTNKILTEETIQAQERIQRYEHQLQLLHKTEIILERRLRKAAAEKSDESIRATLTTLLEIQETADTIARKINSEITPPLYYDQQQYDQPTLQSLLQSPMYDSDIQQLQITHPQIPDSRLSEAEQITLTVNKFNYPEKNQDSKKTNTRYAP